MSTNCPRCVAALRSLCFCVSTNYISNGCQEIAKLPVYSRSKIPQLFLFQNKTSKKSDQDNAKQLSTSRLSALAAWPWSLLPLTVWCLHEANSGATFTSTLFFFFLLLSCPWPARAADYSNKHSTMHSKATYPGARAWSKTNILLPGWRRQASAATSPT